MSDKWTEPAESSNLTWVEESFVAEYKQAMKVFFSHLVELNVNIYIVEHIFAFPLNLFSPGHPEGTIFFSQVIDNFLDQSVLTITKLVTDQGANQRQQVYTLKRFKNNVNKYVKVEYRDDLREKLKSCDFEMKTTTFQQKAEKMRNQRIAHFPPEAILGPFDQTHQPERILFSELQVFCNELNKLYEALTFDAECFMLPLTYQDNVSDINWILESVAKNSNILNMPERNPRRWSVERQRLTEDELYHINHYRKKFDLIEV